jgi:hypothetical protein
LYDGIVINLFFAFLVAFILASEISFALPFPYPTLPFLSPIIVIAVKEKLKQKKFQRQE